MSGFHILKINLKRFFRNQNASILKKNFVPKGRDKTIFSLYFTKYSQKKGYLDPFRFKRVLYFKNWSDHLFRTEMTIILKNII